MYDLLSPTAETTAFIPSLKVNFRTKEIDCRVSAIIGRSVTNGSNVTVGKIEDLLIDLKDSVLLAVLSVGDFLGVGNRHVVVHYNTLEAHDGQIVYRNATQESLKSLPEFHYIN